LTSPFCCATGIDFEQAKICGVDTIWSLSLPGKVAPVTAGDIIKETILNILKQESL
jgi:dipicolinate synthase subunit A